MTDDLNKSKVLSVESTVEGAVNELAALTAVKRPALDDLPHKHKAKRIKEYDLLPDDDQGLLKWRGDPKDTFSDWTIEVVSEGPVVPVAAPAPAPELATSTSIGDVMVTPAAKGAVSMISPSPGISAEDSKPSATSTSTMEIEIETQTQTFHVHRYFLGFGTRRSHYFAKLFQESQGGISRSNKTLLELEPLAAKAFPAVLDFLYDPKSPLEIHTDTATALHHLGTQLEMTHLQHYAKEFLVHDLSLQNLETYYHHAKQFQDPVVMEIIVHFIASNISEISASSNFVKHQTTADLWTQALHHVILSPTNYSTDLHLSKLVTEFVLANRQLVTAAIFQDLTNDTKIRQVDPDVALQLVQLDDDLHNHPDATATQGQQLTSLADRCATALGHVWKELDPQDLLVQNRSPVFLCQLLAKCLQQAKKEMPRTSRSTTAATVGTTSLTSRSSRASHRADRVDSTPARRPTRGAH
jgi:BTB/POZ domain